MSKLRVKINIAGRHYPLTVNAEEELAVRNAGKEINRLIQEFEEQYAVTDKQDAISMVALQMASKLNLQKQASTGNDSELNEKMKRLIEFIDKELELNN
ncbi:MAG: cell division protein ZapA [Moheibacter sp.]